MTEAAKPDQVNGSTQYKESANEELDRQRFEVLFDFKIASILQICVYDSQA